MTAETPRYWSIDPDTWRAWVAVLGNAAASKLAGACMSYFFDGTEPDAYKLTRQARAMFEGERGKLDRRRASALNGAKGGRKGAGQNVDNSKDAGKADRNSHKDVRKIEEKLPRNQTDTTPSSSGNVKPRFEVIENSNRNTNPQTPKHSATLPTLGAGVDSVMSPAEFNAMIASGLGYVAPTAYGSLAAAQRAPC